MITGRSSQGITNMKGSSASAQNAYVGFREFVDSLPEPDRVRLQNTSVLFCYPVLDRNEFDLVEHPVSQRILIAALDSANVETQAQVALVNGDAIALQPEAKAEPTHVVIQPMIGSLEGLGAVLRFYKGKYPSAKIILHNSDQHQHEKLIGGPGSKEIAAHLLNVYPAVNWVILGFAEHSLVSILLDNPTTAVQGQTGSGQAPTRFFNFGSLPFPETVVGGAEARGRTIRVQRARGCLSACTYCIEGQANKSNPSEKTWDGHGIPAFVDYLSGLQQQGYFFINVVDSSFEDPGRKGLSDLLTFCQEIVQRKIPLSFKIHLRAETVLKMTPDDIRLMKAAGVDVAVIGIESGNQAELDYFHKIASKDVSREAFNKLEAGYGVCIILGYIMFTPLSTKSVLKEKVEFLRDIERGWDFLNLSNRLRVYWGTKMHHQLIADGFSDHQDITLGYVPFRFREPLAAQLDGAFNDIKRQRPGFLKLNTAMYDALNLEARMLNPVNDPYREMAGESFLRFQERLAERRRRLSNLYADGFQAMIEEPEKGFIPSFDPMEEFNRQEEDVKACLGFASKLDRPPTTLQLHTWLSVFDRFGHKDGDLQSNQACSG